MVEQFQFYLSSIKRICRTLKQTSQRRFNSTLVQLKVTTLDFSSFHLPCFNSTLVQLKVVLAKEV